MSRIKKPIPTREDILNVYTSVNATAPLFNVSGPTFKSWLKMYNIPLNKQVGRKEKKNVKAHALLSDKAWLIEHYINQNKSKEEVARLAGCTTGLANQYFTADIEQQKTDIKTRIINEYQSGVKMRDISLSSPSTISRWLKDKNIEARMPNSYDRPFVKISKGHQEIINFLNEYNIPIKINDRSLGTEFDIAVHDRKFLIEFNGLFYHNETAGKDSKYHLNKLLTARQCGYQLFHVYEDQWVHNKDIVKSMILSKLNLITNKYYARECQIISILSADRIKFFDTNHIQGDSSVSLAYALVINNRIVACMSFRKPRFNKHYEWELVRYASELNSIVVGGFSKLLAHFRRNHSGSIISYSDNSYSVGNVYSKAGFTMGRVNPPSYYYCDLNKNMRLRRTQFTKKALEKIGADTRLTEKEIMQQLKIPRIWDCGSTVWTIE